jgi:diguanylate cyclase (GGDEF)-like protein
MATDDGPLRVLLVEDDEDDYFLTRDLLSEIPGRRYELDWIADAGKALATLDRGRYDVALIDYRLGSCLGSDLVRGAIAQGCKIPLILLTGLDDRETDVAAMDAGAVDFLVKGRLDSPMLERAIRYALQRRRSEEALRRGRDELEDRVAERTAELAAANRDLRAEVAERKRAEREISTLNEELTQSYDATIEGWARALDLRDKETEGHSRRVTELTVRLARVVGLSPEEIEHVRRGALLHDIGKMGIPDQILHKPGPLTDEEWGVMRRHPQYAQDWLAPIAFLRPALAIPHCHHEKWDGTGYPRGLSGEQIPLTARIFAAVDIWDALSNDRSYRRAWPRARVLDHLRSMAGTHLDPRVVDLLIRCLTGVLEGATTAAQLLVAKEPSTPGRDDPTDAGRERLTILIADGDGAASSRMRRMVEGLDHEVLVAADGDEAWQFLQDHRVHVVISDWIIPGLDGPGLCRRVRGRVGSAYTYFILVTGRGGAEDWHEGLAAGADDFLVKPPDIGELAARLAMARRIVAMQGEQRERAAQVERMHAALRSQNAELARLARTDELTGLCNRRELGEVLRLALALVAREGRPTSLILLDLDDFKAYNDRFGHPAGNEVLRRVAAVLRGQLREHDVAARYGGDEFAVLLSGVDADEARSLAEQVRSSIQSAHWPLRPVTASVGIATASPGRPASASPVEEADEALYRAKKAGRNRVVHHEEETGSP